MSQSGVYVSTLIRTTEELAVVWPYKFYCKLQCRNIEELHAFALALGLIREAYVPEGQLYRLTANMRRRAVSMGAQPRRDPWTDRTETPTFAQRFQNFGDSWRVFTDGIGASGAVGTTFTSTGGGGGGGSTYTARDLNGNAFNRAEFERQMLNNVDTRALRDPVPRPVAAFDHAPRPDRTVFRATGNIRAGEPVAIVRDEMSELTENDIRHTNIDIGNTTVSIANPNATAEIRTAF